MWLSQLWLPHCATSGGKRCLVRRVWARMCWAGRRHGMPGCRGEKDHRGRRQPRQVCESRGARSHWMCQPRGSRQAHPGGFGGDDRRRGGLRSGVCRESSCHGGCGTVTHITLHTPESVSMSIYFNGSINGPRVPRSSPRSTPGAPVWSLGGQREKQWKSRWNRSCWDAPWRGLISEVNIKRVTRPDNLWKLAWWEKLNPSGIWSLVRHFWGGWTCLDIFIYQH